VGCSSFRFLSMRFLLFASLPPLVSPFIHISTSLLWSLRKLRGVTPERRTATPRHDLTCRLHCSSCPSHRRASRQTGWMER
jgi:hypothetical protein